MSDETDKEQKTEAPTQKRIDEFKKQGRVPFSRDLVGAASFFVGLGVLAGAGRMITSVVLVDVRERMSALSGAPELVWPVRPLVALAITVIVLCATVSCASLAQMGLPAELDLLKGAKNYQPLQRIAKLFGLQGWKQLGVQLIKMSVLVLVLYAMLRSDWVALSTSSQVPLMESLGFAARFGWKLGLASAMTLFGLGALDYLRMKREIDADMKMSKEEIKREMKEDGGNPLVKRRMRALIKSLVKNDLKKAVATADVVVVNPTHYAVAIKYDSKRMRAPRVVAKGVDHLALRIRAMAAEARIPTIENVPLARGLHAQVKVGKDIPVELYRAVAEVLAAVYRARKGGRA